MIAAYLAALLAVDTQVGLPGQLALGGLTWLVLLVAARPLPAERRAQVAVVICAATLAEVTGSISGASTRTGCTTCRRSFRRLMGSCSWPACR